MALALRSNSVRTGNCEKLEVIVNFNVHTVLQFKNKSTG